MTSPCLLGPSPNQSSYTKGVFSVFALPTKKGVFLYICTYSNQSPSKRVFGSIIALILIKALPKRVFFSIIALILTKALSKGFFFLYLCPYSNQSPTKNCVFFSIFALTVTKALQKRVFFSNFALILTKFLPKRADLLALICGVCCEFVTFRLVSMVRCST